MLSTAIQFVLVPLKLGSSVIVCTVSNPSKTCSSITTFVEFSDLTPNLSTAFIK